MEREVEVIQPMNSIETDPTTGKKIMPYDKHGLVGNFTTLDHEGNVKLTRDFIDRAGVTLPPNDEWIALVEVGGSDQGISLRTTQTRCENCRANYKTFDYHGKQLCIRCRDDAEFRRRLVEREKHSKWLIVFEIMSDFDTYQEYIATRNKLPMWVRNQDLIDHELELGRILTQDELNEYVTTWIKNNELGADADAPRN
jgi:hypothetical protein